MINGFVTVLAVLSIGYILKRFFLRGESIWRGLEDITYYVLFPCLIVKIFLGTEVANGPWLTLLILIIAQIVMFFAGWSGSRMVGPNDASWGVVAQSNVRTNAFVAISVSAGLLGAEGLQVATIALTLLIPSSNILSVIALKLAANQPSDLGIGMVRALAKNPLVIAAIIGLALAILPIKPPELLILILEVMGKPVLTLGLLTAGAAISFKSIGTAGSSTIIWSIFRLTAFPVLVVILCGMLELSRVETLVAFVSVAAPTATGGYILAKKLGANAEMAANMIAVQTVLSAVSAPILYFAFFS